jgi:hypothetical protein
MRLMTTQAVSDLGTPASAVLTAFPKACMALRLTCEYGKSPLANRYSSYEDGEDKRRIHAAGNHFILSHSQ